MGTTTLSYGGISCGAQPLYNFNWLVCDVGEALYVTYICHLGVMNDGLKIISTILQSKQRH